jgi:hypothetical protein
VSKGSRRRPINPSIERKVFEDNWDRIFNKLNKDFGKTLESLTDYCEECDGTGKVIWYVGLDFEQEEEECDVCKGSGLNAKRD